MKNRSNNRGETIVEVLISIVVVGGVLSGAYYLLSRSYRQSQAAAERVAGTKAAESKLEVLRTLTPDQLGSINEGSYCISTNVGDIYDISTKDESCKVNDRYTVTVSKTGAVYKVKSEWDGLTSPKESVTLYYKP